MAGDLITRLYDRLESNGSEVVFFDVNHSAAPDASSVLARMWPEA